MSSSGVSSSTCCPTDSNAFATMVSSGTDIDRQSSPGAAACLACTNPICPMLRWTRRTTETSTKISLGIRCASALNVSVVAWCWWRCCRDLPITVQSSSTHHEPPEDTSNSCRRRLGFASAEARCCSTALLSSMAVGNARNTAPFLASVCPKPKFAAVRSFPTPWLGCLIEVTLDQPARSNTHSSNSRVAA
jgi:hypothetical protein